MCRHYKLNVREQIPQFLYNRQLPSWMKMLVYLIYQNNTMFLEYIISFGTRLT